MKHKIIKKTIIYRILAYIIALAIGLLSPIPITISIWFVSISEGVSLATYYIYEYLWDSHINRQRLKTGMKFFTLLAPDKDKYGWFSVIKVLDGGKLVIEVE